ncbi:MAG: hypothetical protein K6C36_01510 [Clostridia bacterium]|nr:hypothetical protein [Clostridia bacterium]
MKKAKTMLALLIALALVFSFIPLSVADDIPQLPINATTTLTATGDYADFTVVAPYDCMITVTSVGEADTYGVVYDAEHNVIASNDDGGEGRNFALSAPVLEGETAYFGATLYGGGEGDIQVLVTADPIQELPAGEPFTVFVGEGKTVLLKYECPYNHIVSFTSDTEYDTKAYLYDADMNQLEYNDDGGEGSNFLINHECEEGATYFLGVFWYDSSAARDMVVRADAEHEYKSEIIKQPNCKEEGIRRYTCVQCGHFFEMPIPKHHNDGDGDGYCDGCGNPYFVELDLAFVIDTTGSMGDDIESVRASMKEIIAALDTMGLVYRCAVIDYRDFADRTGDSRDYPYKVQQDFTWYEDEITAAIDGLTLGYGGDSPETVYSGVIDGLAELSWASTSKKACVIMGDAAPLDPEPNTGYTLLMAQNALTGIDTLVSYDVEPALAASPALGRYGAPADGYSAMAICPGETIMTFTVSTEKTEPLAEFADLSAATGGTAYAGSGADAGAMIASIVTEDLPDALYAYGPGDVDGDKEVTAQDARAALRIALKLEDYTAVQFSAADIDLDGEITAQDARAILRKSIGLA